MTDSSVFFYISNITVTGVYISNITVAGVYISNIN